MCQLAGMTKTELQAHTKGELIDLVGASANERTWPDFTVRQIDQITGLLIKYTVKYRTIFDNTLTGGQKVRFKYYDDLPTVIHKIFVTTYNADWIEIAHCCIVHSRSGNVKPYDSGEEDLE